MEVKAKHVINLEYCEFVLEREETVHSSEERRDCAHF
jgi:hypothetical protein